MANEDTPQETVPLPEDRLEVRVFTFADYATVSPDGKLYISGGGVDRIFVPQVPGALGQLWLALRLRIPWNMTSDRSAMVIRVWDSDRHTVGPDPWLRGDVEVGRAPGQRPGDEAAIQLALPVTGFQIKGEGTLHFHLSINDQAITSLPLRVVLRPAMGTPQV